jgi:signal transduction histidine kinase
MLKPIRKLSLRTRLALLAGFAIVALAVALVVAWRLARATETFTLREADSAVHNAARDLARELKANPAGYTSLDQASPLRPGGKHERPPVPPHVTEIFSEFSDPLTRLSAVTLHRYSNVDGGFYRSSDAQLVGGTMQASASSSLLGSIQSVIQESSNTGMPASRVVQIGNDRIIAAAYPVDGEPTMTAWAVSRLPFFSGLSDWPNFIALVALGISFVAVCGLAFVTVKDLRSGVSEIENGLALLKLDLNGKVEMPATAELRTIAAAINELAETLRSSIERRTRLETELRRNERLSALGRVVTGVAHEVRNPLSAIKLKVQMAQRSTVSDEKLAGTFNVVLAEIERLDSLVRRLLELGGQQTLERTTVDVRKLICERVALFSDLYDRAGVRVLTDEVEAGVVVTGDEHRLSQVFDNIIQNALEAMSNGGELVISSDIVRSEEGTTSARLTFSDTGPGIPESQQQHIFEPFFTSRANGTGLGLAIARGIIDEHLGEISFSSRPGYGSSFVVWLPTLEDKG